MLAVPPTEAERFLERWEFLLPWCVLLRGHLGIEGTFSDHSALGEYHWLSVQLPTAPAIHQVVQLREALELLALVAYVDNAAWKRLLTEQCHLPLDDEEETIDGEFLPRLLFQFDESYLKYNSLAPAALCEQFFLTKKSPSAKYRTAVSTILSMGKNVGRESERIPWRLPFAVEVVNVWNLSPAKLAAHLTYLMASLHEIQGQTQGIRTVPATYRPFDLSDEVSPDGFAHFFSYELESLKICLGSINVWDHVPPVVLTMLGTGSLNFAELHLAIQQSSAVWGEIDDHSSSLSDRVTAGLLFSSLLYGQSVVSEPDSSHQTINRRCRVESVVMQCNHADPWILTCLSSAVASSHGIERLTLDGYFNGATDTPINQTWKWRWLAFALFRRHSHSSVKHLTITKARINHEDVVAIADVITSNHPYPASELPADMKIRELTVRSGTLVRLYAMNPHVNSEVCLTITAAQDFACEAFDHHPTSEWIDIVIPGLGFGSVRRDEVVFNTQAPDINQSPSGSEVETLVLAIDHEETDMEALVDLLRLIGSPLKSLSLLSVGSAVMDIRQIVQCCPNLVHLLLDTVQIDLDALVADIEHQYTPVSSLLLTCMRIPSEQLTCLARVLADPSSRTARQLKEVCVSADNDEFPTTEETLVAFLGVLDANKRLEYLDLLVLPNLFDKYCHKFLAYHREVLAIEKEKLSLPCRLAFLSVLKAEHHSSSWLGNHVIDEIFSFAAECVRRTVCIRCDH